MSGGELLGRIKLSLATATDVRSLAASDTPVTTPDTHDNRNPRHPAKPDGLFCEKIFGPAVDWECYCGKYSGQRFKGSTCEKCGVEITNAQVRRDRMGHIELAAPVIHTWYFKGTKSVLPTLLGIAPADLRKVVYYQAYVVTRVDTTRRDSDMPRLKTAPSDETPSKPIRDLFLSLAPRQVITVDDFMELQTSFPRYFAAGMGAEPIRELLSDLDLDAEVQALRQEIAGRIAKTRRAAAERRLNVVAAFQLSGNKPESMVLDVLPVLPPELRPEYELGGGELVRTDLNALYAHVIQQNERLGRVLRLEMPGHVLDYEKQLLQGAVDALFDNRHPGTAGRPTKDGHRRVRTSLSDLLKGKEGRFRKNLLGKRVDFSGRSVIVVGPQLKLHQCGLPMGMALELFKPFVVKGIIQKVLMPLSSTPRSTRPGVDAADDMVFERWRRFAEDLVARQRPVAVAVLEDTMRENLVLLNRAPTLHRVGVQAFEPILVTGNSIQLHPMVCTAFNADFDGDQMAVHLPLGPEAQAEARILMLASRNILSPASGRPLASPRLDIVTGLHYLTTLVDGDTGEYQPATTARPYESGVFASPDEALMAVDRGTLSIRASIKIRLTQLRPPTDPESELFGEAGWKPGDAWMVQTTLGRVLFNELLLHDLMPARYPYVNEQMNKRAVDDVVNDLCDRAPTTVVAQILDKLKEAGFHWATRSGVTIAMSDVQAAPNKAGILADYEAKARTVEQRFHTCEIDHEERSAALVEIWTDATNDVGEAVRGAYPPSHPLRALVDSGAAGTNAQLNTLGGMKGLVAGAAGKTIPEPIKSSFLHGLTVLEYFNNTHGARKGLSDTAIRTGEAGYLTRRLVDVGQDVVVREADCRTPHGITATLARREADGSLVRDEHIDTSATARILAHEAVDAAGNLVAERGCIVDAALVEQLLAAEITKVSVRSVLTCDTDTGVCTQCYGHSLATGRLVDVGEPVGIVAAQSIGEPGTQLTLRTFHRGGAAGADITGGLPRVVQLFEARVPRDAGPIANVAGTVTVQGSATDQSLTIIVSPDDGGDPVVYDKLPRHKPPVVATGEHVRVGTPLLDGVVDPHQVLRTTGMHAVQSHLVFEIQQVYRQQGVAIHDKHIEIIFRQLLRRVIVVESGSTDLLPGALPTRTAFNAENQRTISAGGAPAIARSVLLGLTKSALATDSWLSAAAFQETARVLTDAAIRARQDDIEGLKENMILGKLIPAGTGFTEAASD